jgi:LmbE family N-acetylglucosaminyl deacetylase
MKALCLVAHPDDCIIFGLGYILAHPEYHWRICYLTYRLNSPRGKEIADFWEARNIPVDFLGFRDDPSDIKTNQLSFDPIMANNFIDQEIGSADLVLTHGPAGEYGHIHHKFVHDCCQHHSNLVTFAQTGVAYTVPSNYYRSADLPIHGSYIEDFVDPANQINCYSRA